MTRSGIDFIGRVEAPTLIANQGYWLTLDTTGALRVTTVGAAGAATTAIPADNLAAGIGLETLAFNFGFDRTNSNWDRATMGASAISSAAAVTGAETAGLLGVQNVAPMAMFNSPDIVIAAAGTAVLQATSAGFLRTTEQFAPGAEDNTNAIIAVVHKPLAVSTYVPSRFVDFAANATANIKATAGNVFSFSCHNLNAAARFFQLHNTETTPAGGAVPLLTFLVPAGTMIIVGNDFFTQTGLNFSTGIAFGFSTTEGTYTAGAAGDQFSQVTFK